MNIIFDYKIYHHQKYGGISRYFSNLAENLSEKDGVNVKVLAPIHLNRYLYRLKEKKLVSGVPVRSMNRFQKIIIDEINYGISVGNIFINRPDIVHETYYSSRSICSGAAKVITTIHDMIPEKFHVGDKTAIVQLRKKHKSIQRSNHIITVSKNTKKDLVEILGVDPEKISVVYHGAKIDNDIEVIGCPVTEPFILYIGTRNHYKNFFRFIRSFTRSKYLSNNLKIVCFGGGEFTKQENEKLKKEGMVLRNIKNIQGGDQVLVSLYKKAEALIFPSLYEGFGMPLLEAMSLCCPVVCSNTSSIPEIVGNAGLMFDPNSEEEITEAIEKLIGSESKKNELIKCGIKQVEKFSWERCAKETLNVYERCMDGV